FKEKNEEARVHFIPYLKEGVFVTLCAPVVKKICSDLHRNCGLAKTDSVATQLQLQKVIRFPVPRRNSRKKP
ncbi:hypothetical protein, partial [Methanosarcina mazei]|uniref:hypothetical protein n=1 Tax=Methanosarcina mazei TaxID=2209 RepID=UPI001F20371A